MVRSGSVRFGLLKWAADARAVNESYKMNPPECMRTGKDQTEGDAEIER